MDFSVGAAEVVRARAYVREVLWRLGLRGESSCVESEAPLCLYLAVDGHLPPCPGLDVALLWTAGRGWELAVENGIELTVVARLPGEVRPPASVVARWARDHLSSSATTSSRAQPRQVAVAK